MSKLVGRSLAGALVFLALLTLGFTIAQPDGTVVKRERSHGKSFTQPPQHVEWRSFDVGGMIIVNPAVVDSTGSPDYLLLPPGSRLIVPFLVKGESQEEMWHKL